MKPPIGWTLKTQRERDIFEAGYNCGKVDTQVAYAEAAQGGASGPQPTKETTKEVMPVEPGNAETHSAHRGPSQVSGGVTHPPTNTSEVVPASAPRSQPTLEELLNDLDFIASNAREYMVSSASRIEVYKRQERIEAALRSAPPAIAASPEGWQPSWKSIETIPPDQDVLVAVFDPDGEREPFVGEAGYWSEDGIWLWANQDSFTDHPLTENWTPYAWSELPPAPRRDRGEG